MAHHQSAKKRIKTSLRKKTKNKTYLASVRTAVKRFQSAMNQFSAGTVTDITELKKLYTQAQSKLAKAAQKGMIHKNNTARKISAITHLLKATDKVAGDNTAAVTAKAKPEKKSSATKTKKASAPTSKAKAKSKSLPKAKTSSSKSKK